MSRSFKKHPICKDPHKRRRFYKRQASKKARLCKDIRDGAVYKKAYDSRYIVDYRSYVPFEVREREWEGGKRQRFKTYEEMKRHWQRYFKQK